MQWTDTMSVVQTRPFSASLGSNSCFVVSETHFWNSVLSHLMQGQQKKYLIKVLQTGLAGVTSDYEFPV